MSLQQRKSVITPQDRQHCKQHPGLSAERHDVVDCYGGYRCSRQQQKPRKPPTPARPPTQTQLSSVSGGQARKHSACQHDIRSDHEIRKRDHCIFSCSERKDSTRLAVAGRSWRPWRSCRTRFGSPMAWRPKRVGGILVLRRTRSIRRSSIHPPSRSCSFYVLLLFPTCLGCLPTRKR